MDITLSFDGEKIEWVYLIADGTYPEYKVFATMIRSFLFLTEEQHNRMVSGTIQCGTSYWCAFAKVWNSYKA